MRISELAVSKHLDHFALQPLFDQISDGLVLFDPESYQLLDANEVACKLYEFDPADLPGLNLMSFAPPSEQEKLRKVLGASKMDPPCQGQHLTRQGEPFPVEFHGGRIRLSGVDLGYILVRDLREWQQALVHIAHGRDEAIQTSRRKSDYVAAMSYELRSPVSNIHGISRLLLDSPLEEDQKEHVEEIHDISHAMLNRLNEILDLSRIERGQLDFQPRPFDLKVALQDLVRMMLGRAKDSSLELKLHFPSDVPSAVIGDSERLRQLLGYLLRNAIKFTVEGHVALRVAAIKRSEKDVHLQISIEDTGVGIDQERLDTIFDTADSNQDPSCLSSGEVELGLALSHRMATLMGGGLQATSHQGHGSTFILDIVLPLDLQADVTTRRPSGRKALLVHADPVGRLSYEDELSNQGFRVSVAPSSSQALEIVQSAYEEEAPFDLAVIDYSLPDLDGETLGRAIRAHRSLENMQLLLILSRDRNLEEDRLKNAGFAAAIFDPSELVRVLQDSVEASSGGVNELSSLQADGDVTGEIINDGLTRVLVVEDNPVNQKVITHMLMRLNCEIQLAENGIEALQALEEKPEGYFQIILMDCLMPEMDGYEATSVIRGLSNGNRRIPIVAVTANAMEGDREKCLDCGMDDYMAKPVTSIGLSDMLEKWAGQSSKKGVSAAGVK